jgi:hypothetical protein
MTIAQQDEEYLRCALDPIYFIESYCRVWDKRKEQWVAFVLFPHQVDVVTAYQTHKKNVVQKYRQGGITSISCAYMAWLLNFHEGMKVAVVADKLKLAVEQIFRTIADLVAALPEWMRVKAMTDSKIMKVYDNDAILQAFAATKDGLRGFSPDFLFVDEAAYLAYGDEFMASAKGTMSVNGRMVLNSTPRGQDPVYWQTYDSALNGRNNFNIVAIFWYEDPRFNEDLRWEKTGCETVYTRDKLEGRELLRKGYKPISTWYLNMCKEYEFDAKKISQEIECVGGDTLVTVRHERTGKVSQRTIASLHNELTISC